MSAAVETATYRIHRYPSSLIDRLVLDDGRVVTVRPVLPQDAEAEQAFVGALSPTSRRERFHLTLNMLPESVLRQFTEIDYRSHVALVAEANGDDDESILVADARYVRRADPAIAEFALVVADEWQGVGLGNALLQRLVQHARRSGVARLQGDMLASNAAMAALAHRFGARMTFVAGDATLLRASISC
ncbi:MAG: N-acetyltransferase family protein [Gemmatimonadota bacterium]